VGQIKCPAEPGKKGSEIMDFKLAELGPTVEIGHLQTNDRTDRQEIAQKIMPLLAGLSVCEAKRVLLYTLLFIDHVVVVKEPKEKVITT